MKAADFTLVSIFFTLNSSKQDIVFIFNLQNLMSVWFTVSEKDWVTAIALLWLNTAIHIISNIKITQWLPHLLSMVVLKIHLREIIH